MKYGDLSSKSAPSVGVRFEAVVYNFGQVNEPGKAYCERLLMEDVNLLFLTTLPERKVKAWCYKWRVIYTNVVACESILEIPELARHHHLLLYVDVDERLLEAVSERGNPQTKVLKWQQPYQPSPQ